MFKLVSLLALTISAVMADPKPSGVIAAAPLAVAPAVAPAVVTAHSSQVIARNYNALVAPAVAAPVAAVRSPVVAAPLPAAPFFAPAAPLVAPASPYYPASYTVAGPALASPYLSAPIAAPFW